MGEFLRIKTLFVLLTLASSFECLALSAPRITKVLVFSLTKGYRHASISDGIEAIKAMGAQHQLQIDTSESAASMNTQNLKRYKLLIFLSPTGTNVFNQEQKQALQDYIRGGGRLVGIHAATDFCYEWDWYGKMIGAYFESHPKVQKVKLNLLSNHSKLLKGLPKQWIHEDEWYNFKQFNPEVKVLIRADETSYQGGKMNNNHPVSWYHHFEGGKVFYTALGHTKACYQDPVFLQHLWLGIKWALN